METQHETQGIFEDHDSDDGGIALADIPLDRMVEIEGNDDFQSVSWFPLDFDFLNFNHEFEPFKDARVREAFDLMLDKEVLMEGALWG